MFFNKQKNAIPVIENGITIKQVKLELIHDDPSKIERDKIRLKIDFDIATSYQNVINFIFVTNNPLSRRDFQHGSGVVRSFEFSLDSLDQISNLKIAAYPLDWKMSHINLCPTPRGFILTSPLLLNYISEKELEAAKTFIEGNKSYHPSLRTTS